MNFDYKKRNYTIAVDTREKKPILFPECVETIKEALNPGDYSVIGYEKKMAIERKSVDDYITCIVNFKHIASQIKRLKDVDYRMILVTGSYMECMHKLEEKFYLYKKTTFKQFNSVLHYAERLGVTVYFIEEQLTPLFIINQFDTWLKWLKEEEKNKDYLRYRF